MYCKYSKGTPAASVTGHSTGTWAPLCAVIGRSPVITARSAYITRHGDGVLRLAEPLSQKKGVHDDIAHAKEQHGEEEIEVDTHAVPSEKLHTQVPDTQQPAGRGNEY